jgi:Domain of unknown function (DUF4247)
MTPKRLFIVAGVLGAVGLLVGSIALFSGGSSPRGYVEHHFTRDASRDIGKEAAAYTATDKPSVVADRISGEWKPADELVDGSGVYLRYAEDSVVILPLLAGSLILVEALRTAYPRYHGIVGGYWGWNTRDGGDFRGGGPGAGK